MGTLTLAQLKDEIRVHLGNRTDQDSRLTTALNIAQTRIARLRDFEELQVSADLSYPTTFQDDPTLDRFINFSSLTNSDPREFYSLIIRDEGRSVKLKRKTVRQMDSLIPMPDHFSTNRPQLYVIWADRIELWPVPDQQYSGIIRFSKWPTVFSDSDTTPTSDFRQKDDILLYMGVSYIYHSLGEYDRAKQFYGFAKTNYDEAVFEDSEKPDLDIAPASEFPSFSNEYWKDPWVRSVT